MSHVQVDRAGEPRSIGTVTHPSILLIGDDPLMVRALDRLLRKAGYDVGIGDRSVDSFEGLDARERGPEVALTIVDVPDEWFSVVSTQPPIAPAPSWRDAERVLWISNIGDVVSQPERCLVKPFTANQLLAKVETLMRQPVKS